MSCSVIRFSAVLLIASNMRVAYENGGLGYGFIDVASAGVVVVCAFSTSGFESRLQSHCMLVRLSSREGLASPAPKKN